MTSSGICEQSCQNATYQGKKIVDRISRLNDIEIFLIDHLNQNSIWVSNSQYHSLSSVSFPD